MCACVPQPPGSIVTVVSPSKPGEGVCKAFGLLVCFTLPLFVCVFVRLLVQAPVSLRFLLSIVCMKEYTHTLSLSILWLALSNQCLIGLIPLDCG